MAAARAEQITELVEKYHRFHSYCARFPTSLVREVIRDFTKRGDSVFDPFCGSGTSLVAGLIAKRLVVGGDIDALAGMISRAKCAPRSASEYERWKTKFEKTLISRFSDIQRNWSNAARPKMGKLMRIGSMKVRIPSLPQLAYWFPPQLITALAVIAETAHECDDAHLEQVALISLSASIIAKWPKTLSYAMDIDHTRPHRRIQKFTLDRILSDYLRRLDRSIHCLGGLEKIYRDAGVIDRINENVTVFCPQDARENCSEIADESQALVITSPPYFNAVDYPRAHRLSVCWMNGYAPGDLASRRDYIGLHSGIDADVEAWLQDRAPIRRLMPVTPGEHPSIGRRLVSFAADLDAAVKQVHRKLRPRGFAVFVIADNLVRGRRLAAHRILAEIARTHGFSQITTNRREIAKLRRRFPVGPFGFDGPMTHEYTVAFHKPGLRRKGRLKAKIPTST